MTQSGCTYTQTFSFDTDSGGEECITELKTNPPAPTSHSISPLPSFFKIRHINHQEYEILSDVRGTEKNIYFPALPHFPLLINEPIFFDRHVSEEERCVHA